LPNIVKVPESYASAQVYSRIKEAAQKIGEELIAFSMYHVNRDEGTQPRCACYDNIYGSSQNFECPLCYGTTFAGGIRDVWRVWGIITDDANSETIRKDGVWSDENHTVQTEPYPNLYQHDYVLRIPRWDSARGIPLIFGKFYEITNDVLDVSIRTGNRYASANVDRVAQKFDMKVLPENHPINRVSVRNDLVFPRYDGQPR
jgi:hypothetical protein